MFKFKTPIIALAITFLTLAGFVNSSDAIEITDLSPTDGNYEVTQAYNQYVMHTETVETDQPYSRVEWYVDDVLRETTSGDGVKTEATYHPYFLIGSFVGTDYVIKAVAYPWEGEGSDTDSFTLTVKTEHFEILKMAPNLWFTTEVYDYGYGGNHMVRLETSRPYYYIAWYVDDEFYSTFYNNTDNSGTFAFGNITGLTGSIAGTTYTIKAIAYALDTTVNPTSDTDSYEVTVYEPLYTYDVDGKTTPDIPDVYGYAEITRHYRSGDDIIFDYYADAFYTGNDEDKEYSVSTEIKNTIHGLDDATPQGETGTLDIDNFWFRYGGTDGGTISASLSSGIGGTEYRCEAYVRIKVVDGDDRDDYFINYQTDYTK